MKPITTNVFTFERIVKNGNVYVDKTALIHSLAQVDGGQYFIARPRRFGKSLLVSTLKSIFQGRRELFKGLAIDSLDYDWKTYPVIHLDMGSAQAATADEFTDNLANMLDGIERDYGLSSVGGKSISSRFLNLVNALAAQSPEGKVVILVDEYDKPLLGHLGKPEVIAFRDVLKSFYSVIKTTEGLQRFAFITGVSKFSKVSIFSDLNNLTDLTMSARAATLLGYTKQELLVNFREHIERLAEAIGKSFDETTARLARWYDGYRFHPNASKMFNPVSVGKCLTELEFKNYWFETATPTFLIDLIKKDPVVLGGFRMVEEDFSVYDVERPNVVPLLFQTGYLTITGYLTEDDAEGLYTLDFPNREVRNAFNRHVVTELSGLNGIDRTNFFNRLLQTIRENDIDEILRTTSLFFAQIPHTITLKNEKYYQTIFYSLFTLIGMRIHAEVTTNIGRIDAVVETAQTIFVIEFKLRDTADAALAQIKEKKYYEKYLASGKEIQLVGAAFDPETRNLGKWLVEVLKQG